MSRTKLWVWIFISFCEFVFKFYDKFLSPQTLKNIFSLETIYFKYKDFIPQNVCKKSTYMYIFTYKIFIEKMHIMPSNIIDTYSTFIQFYMLNFQHSTFSYKIMWNMYGTRRSNMIRVYKRIGIFCLNFWDEELSWFTFGPICSYLLLLTQHFDRCVLRLTSDVCKAGFRS